MDQFDLTSVGGIIAMTVVLVAVLKSVVLRFWPSAESSRDEWAPIAAIVIAVATGLAVRFSGAGFQDMHPLTVALNIVAAVLGSGVAQDKIVKPATTTTKRITGSNGNP